MQINLTPQQEIDLSKMRTVNPEAYDLYLKGRFYWNQRNPAAIKESIGYLQKATELDPNFALAYVGLADAYNIGNILRCLLGEGKPSRSQSGSHESAGARSFPG